MKVKKYKEVMWMLLLVLLVVISAGAFFMNDENTMEVYASNDGIESGEAEKTEGVPGEEDVEGGTDEEPGEKPEGGSTISGNELEDISCICTDKCTVSRKNAECAVCAEDYKKCGYITPRVRISISSPNGWYRYGSAEVKVSVEDIVHSPDFILDKVEARIGQNGSYMDITDTLKVQITEDCSVYVSVTDTNGKIYEESRSIRCFDRVKPSLNAGIGGGTLTIQAVDNDSGIKAVYVNGQEFRELTNGTVHIRLQEADSVYENFSIQAMDKAGNVSDSYSLKNPYYKSTDTEDEESGKAKLPESVLPTQAVEAKAEVVDYENTADEGNADESETETEAAKVENVEALSFSDNVSVSSEKAGKEFYTIQTDSGKVFYLIIDNTQSDNNVYFLTEISENDLLHVTGTDYQVLGQNQAVVESALPDREEKEDEEKEEKEEAEEEAVTEPKIEDTEEKRSPIMAYAILLLLAGAVAGGIYFFRTYRREGEDFIDDDEEEDEEIYEKEEGESYRGEDMDSEIDDDGVGADDSVFYVDEE